MIANLHLPALKQCFDVARLGSFAAVAREQGLDPSIISRSVAGVEAVLGFALFERTTRRLNLTEAGNAYLARAAALTADLEAARLESLDLVAQPSGTLRITASTAFGSQWLMRRLGPFLDQYPELTLDAQFTDSEVDIAAEGLDLAVRLAPRPNGSLVSTKLMDTRYRVVASPDYLERNGKPETPDGIASHNAILLDLPGYRSRWKYRQDGVVSEVAVSGRMRFSSPTGVRAAALEGNGLALVACWMVERDLEEGRLIYLFPDWEITAADFDTAAWLLYPSRAYVPLKVRLLIDYLKANSRTPG